MPRLAVDIDDTLYSFTDEAREQLSLMIDEPGYAPYQEQLKSALYSNWNQWRTPMDLCGFADDGVTRRSLWLECIARCHDEERISAQTPFPGAVEVLSELVEAGHTLKYVSNRATATERATKNWLGDYDFPGGELIVTDQPKRAFIRDCQYMIDDRIRNVLSFIYDPTYTCSNVEWSREERGWVVPEDKRRQAFSLITDFNSGLTDVPGLWLAHRWTGLRRYMVKTGLLPERTLTHA